MHLLCHLVLQDVIVSECFRLLQEGVELYRYCAACPEMSLPVIAALRKFAKATKACTGYCSDCAIFMLVHAVLNR
jgi:hypothetical protein